MQRTSTVHAAITGNFIQKLKTAQGTTQFSFLRKETQLHVTYFILAMDINLRAFWFSMQEREGAWMIVDAARVPQWICDVENGLSEAICSYNARA